jgi:O-antigen/teichoic acid export membrane protein
MSKVLKNVSFYSLGGILNKSIQFILLPLYAHYLTPEDYGLLELTYLYGAVLIILYGFLVEIAYSRFFFDKTSSDYRAKLFGTALIFKSSFGLLLLFISILFSDEIGVVLLGMENGGVYIKLISVSVLLKSLSTIPYKKIINEKKALRYVIINFIYVLFSLSFTVYFIVVLDYKILGVLYGQIIAASIQLVILLLIEWKQGSFSFSFGFLRSMLAYSIFLVPTQLATFISFWSNRWFLQEHSTMDDLGTFSFGYKIASVIPLLLTEPIKKAVRPEIFSLINEPERCRKNINRFAYITFAILGIAALGLSLLSKELVTIIAPETYLSSADVVFVLSFSYVLFGVAGIVVFAINILKKTHYITITWFISSAMNLLLNFYLVKNYGKAGATYATFITFLLTLILYFIFANKLYKVKFDIMRMGGLFVVFCLSYYFSILLTFNDLFVSIIFKGAIFISVLILIYQFFLKKEDKEIIKVKIQRK